MWGTKGNGNFGLQVSVPKSLCTSYASTSHVAIVKKKVGTFRIEKLFYSFYFLHRSIVFKKNYLFILFFLVKTPISTREVTYVYAVHSALCSFLPPVCHFLLG